MAYIPFDPAHPDPTLDNGTQLADYTRNNLNAIRDAVIMGVFYTWDFTVVGTNPESPDYIEYKSGIIIIRQTFTYNADGFTEEIAYTISVDDGASWDPIGTFQLGYNAEGVLVGGTWA